MMQEPCRDDKRIDLHVGVLCDLWYTIQLGIYISKSSGSTWLITSERSRRWITWDPKCYPNPSLVQMKDAQSHRSVPTPSKISRWCDRYWGLCLARGRKKMHRWQQLRLSALLLVGANKSSEEGAVDGRLNSEVDLRSLGDSWLVRPPSSSWRRR